MKNLILFLFVLFACAINSINAHVAQEQTGVFQKIQDLQQGNSTEQELCAVYEKRPDGSDSNVFTICKPLQFKELVIDNSQNRPVVFKIYSNTHEKITDITNEFQDIAQSFGSKIVFVGLNIMDNPKLYNQIYNMCNLKGTVLPLYLFFNKGQLVMPFLMGFQHKSHFIHYINQLFFIKGSSKRTNNSIINSKEPQ